MNKTNWNWNQNFQYTWGYWFAIASRTNMRFQGYQPLLWAGFAHGTVDYWLKKKGLK